MKDNELEIAYKYSTSHIKTNKDIYSGFKAGWIARGMNDIKKLDAYEKGFRDGSEYMKEEINQGETIEKDN